MLKSERRRSFIIAAVLSFMPCAFVVGTALDPSILETLFHGKVRRGYVIAVLVIGIALESLNKELGSQVLVSEAVWMDVTDLPSTPRGPMKVKGREEPVQIYQLA